MDDSGAALLRAVEVMDRLRSPGGCPWDAAQTHESLARYLLEETYETLEAIETGDARLLREELGDLLLQVLFHARLAEELPSGERFTIADVATDLVDKLIRRHPHVFEAEPGDERSASPSPADLDRSWETLKAQEKKRGSLTDGVPPGQPALAYAEKLVSRVRRTGLAVPTPSVADPSVADPDHPDHPAFAAPGDDIGRRLFALVGEAVAAGVEPETALRRVTRDYRDAIQAAEAELSAGSDG